MPALHPVVPSSTWNMGVDVGKLRDATCVAVVERLVTGNGEYQPIRNSAVNWQEQSRVEFWLRYLEKLPLGENYVDQANYITALYRKEPFNGKGSLIVDRTGVGEGFCDVLRKNRLSPIAAHFTSGHETTGSSRNLGIPKKILVETFLDKHASGEFRAADDLECKAEWQEELRCYTQTQNESGYIRYQHETGHHDDLLTATMLALWQANRATGPAFTGILYG